MPIYEYECTKCGARLEAWQKITEKPLTTCEKCSGKLQKLISQSTFHLKGSGWYATDYSGKSTAGASSAPEKNSSNAPPKPAEKTSAVTEKKDCKK